jgi:hypothetical protein
MQYSKSYMKQAEIGLIRFANQKQKPRELTQGFFDN